MICYKSGMISKKEKIEIESILNELTDIYGDFYITKNNLRLFIKENKDLLFNAIEKVDKLVYAEDKGIILIIGFSEKVSRKYIKILAKDEESADHLLKVVNWNVEEDLWAKVKKNNPIRRVLQRNNYKFAGDRGAEILLNKENIYTDNKGE